MSQTHPETASGKTAPPHRTATLRVEAALARIAEGDGKYHAVSQLFEAEARRNAAQLDKEQTLGAAPGKLQAMPYLVKELIDVEGHLTSFGSDVYATRAPERSAPVIDRLREAGAILLGTTHMVEFAYGSWGTNYVKGTPWNPCDPHLHRVPGGSSSGSAVAVAAGYVPVALGSDTGGSIRIPASLCGVIGFKPSFGLIPTEGVAPLGPSFDTLGTLSRTVRDARLFTEVMSGKDFSHAPLDIKGLRIAVLSREALSPVAPEVEAAFFETVKLLERHGARVSQVTLPLTLVEFQKLNGAIAGYESFACLKPVVEDWRLPMDPYVRQRVLANRDMERSAYDRKLAQLAETRSAFAESFADFDVLALPGTPVCALPVTQVNEAEIPMSRFTRVANCLDLCAITLPLRRPAGALPIGFQLCTPAGTDAYLLSLAEAVSAMTSRGVGNATP